MKLAVLVVLLVTLLTIPSVALGSINNQDNNWLRAIVIAGTDGYPWPDEPNPSAVDPWMFYKRQCTSYAAWKFQAVFGQVFYNTRPGQGSAWNWPALARDQGYSTSSNPRIGIVSWGIGTNMPYGHVAWVEAVNGNGTINVSEYNWGYNRSYSERNNVDPYRYGNPTYISLVPEPSSTLLLGGALLGFLKLKRRV